MGRSSLPDLSYYPKMDSNAQLNRYLELDIMESLKVPYRYAIVCRELSSLLRGAYKKLPKDVQPLLFHHTLSAFQLLPLVQTQTAFAAANVLVQSAEAALPKQKKIVAVKEFKHAKISCMRRSRQNEDLPQLPQDLLFDIFSFLDARSLLSASSVCWEWNLAANDNRLWEMLYTTCFGDTNVEDNTDWRRNFKEKYEGGTVNKLLCERGYCVRCDAIVWLSNMSCPEKHEKRHQKFTPLSPDQIVEYVLNGSSFIRYGGGSSFIRYGDGSSFIRYGVSGTSSSSYDGDGYYASIMRWASR